MAKLCYPCARMNKTKVLTVSRDNWEAELGGTAISARSREILTTALTALFQRGNNMTCLSEDEFQVLLREVFFVWITDEQGRKKHGYILDWRKKFLFLKSQGAEQPLPRGFVDPQSPNGFPGETGSVSAFSRLLSGLRK